MRTLALAVTAGAVISVGCRDQQPVQPAASAGPAYLISDGAHNGNARVFFLPPLAPDPSALFHAGTFNTKLAPVVEVCILTGDPSSGSPVDCMTSGGTPVLVFGPAPMALDATQLQYARTWDTKCRTRLHPSEFYRILVRGAPGGTTLGFLDVEPVDHGIKNLRTREVVQFQDGRTLPINVRIEDGAFGSTNRDHVEQVVGDVATTVTTNTGFAGASFPDNWLPQAARDAGINQVVLIIERIPVGPGTNEPTCLQSGLMEREGCYRFRTDPDLHDFGPFSQLVTAGVCFESPDLIGNPDGPPLGLHRRVEVEGAPAGPTIDLAEVAATFLTCATFGPTPPSIGTKNSGSVLDLARLGWHALVRGIGRLVTPDALHAVDLGAGGSTDGFSRIGWARHVTMTKVAGTDGNSAIAGTTLTPDPAVCLTLTHHGVSSPLGNEPVTFTVMTGAGTVGGGGLNAVTVNTDVGTGCAHAPWVLGTTPGPNTLTAAARASGSPVTYTATGTGRVTGKLYVANFVGNSITVYAAGANGPATPTATTAGGRTGLNFPAAGALHGTGKIYVTNFVGNSITVYAAGASGNATPTATIAGGNTGLVNPAGITLDGAGNIYVANDGGSSIMVYAAGASGNVTPMATIAGGNTGLSFPYGIAVDGAGNIYVSNANVFPLGSITVYGAGASGDVTPTATISGSNTGLNTPALITVVPSGPPGIPLSSQERIFTFDLTSHIPAPPYDAVSWAVTFSMGDPVSGTDVLLTNVYGAANGTQLLQTRNDTQLITAGGTMYGPLTTANPIFNPMLDGIFSFGLVMTSGAAVVTEFKVCGVIFVPFQQTCTSIP